jgi:CHAT domain-containing protein
LTRPFDKHLDSDELDGLVSSPAASVSDSGRPSEPSLEDARRHVESCQDCSRKVQMHKSVQSGILNLSVRRNVPPGPDCVPETEWLNVAAGLLPEAKARELMKHAAQCGHCGPLLKSAAETLAEDITPGEEALLASLDSARPKWQKNMAVTLQTNVQGRQPKPFRLRAIFSWPTPAYAFAGIAAIAIVAWIGVRTLRPPSAVQLLAQAYTEHRTLEPRIPGAQYAPLRVERGAGASNLDKSPALLKAEDLIAENLRQHPNDPAWLQARARADLLDGNYDSAIKSLQRALETEPDSPSLLTDLGTAYYMRAQSADRPIDYGNAIESLGKALSKSPDDPIALFNRALACEHMFLYTQAVDDWQHYLRIDPQGEWSDDARRRLAAVKAKLQQHEKSMSEPLLRPTEIPAELNEAALRGKIDGRIEEYLHVAITEWLPLAFPSDTRSPSNESRTALATLSKILVEQHDDSWLADLLSQPKGTQFPSGIQFLSAALTADDRGDYSTARRSAHSAARLLQQAANPAGELRAKAEEVYSDHLLWEGEACISLLRSLEEPLKVSNYGWLRAQMSLEKSNCASLVGDLGTYQSAIGTGVREARAHHYVSLYLRGLGFEALAVASLADISKSFSLAVSGLAIFWPGHVDLTKGYNLYTDLDAAASELNQPNLQVALWREATALLDRDPDILKRAMAHRWYGMAAYLASMPSTAESEFAMADALFAGSPQTAATTRDRLDAEVWQAKAEVLRGDLQQATKRLELIEPILYKAPSFDPEIGYYSAAAEIAMRRADPAATESALRAALFLSEWALNTFSSEEGRGQWAEQTRDAYRYAVEWKLRQGDANSALELWEWYRGAEVRAAERLVEVPTRNSAMNAPPDPRGAPPLPSPTVVASTLPVLRDETVIAYGAFSDGTAIWAYDDRGIFSSWVATPPQVVRELALRLQRFCSDPASDLNELRTTARSLYDLLIKPIEAGLDPQRTLLFEPDDFLFAVPWDALVDEGGHYLGQRFTTAITPGVYRTMHLRATTVIASGSAALVVSVPVAPGLTPLGDAENEAQSVAAVFSGARLLQGSEATLSAIRTALRGKAVFHFAGHAVASSQRNGLVLAESDPATNSLRLIGEHSVSPRDVRELQLAVLSACNTGNETQSTRPGTEGLADTLLRAGVPHVIASRWKVDSVETASFMKIFYASLLAGNKPASALHEARAALASQPVSAHPYYWAAFALQGVS